MNKVWLKVLSVLVLFLLINSSAVAKPLNDAIVAIVNNDVITLKDLKDYMTSIYRQLKVENKSPQEIQEIMSGYEERGVNQLIEDKLILEAAKQKGLEIRPEVIEKRMKEIKDKYPSEDEFFRVLNLQGMTVTDLKNKMLDQMKSKYMVELEVRDKIFVNPESVTRYYNEHADQFESKARYNIESIYISFDKDGRNEAFKRIKEARSKLMEGANFDEINKEYSQSPSVGVIEKGQMVAAVEKTVFSLKIDELSQPVEVGNGVYLFKLKGVSPSYKQSLVEVKDKIYNIIYNQQFQEKFKAWVDKLRSKAYVEIRG